MTGVKAPTGVLGASVVVTHAAGAHHPVTALGASVAHGTLPFTGIALSVYLALALALILAGVAFRTFGKSGA